MWIGILSDTHDKLERTRIAVELLRAEGAEALFHCGDLASPQIVKACSVLPCYFALGNHDADSVPELQAAALEFGATCLGWGGVVTLADRRIGLVHGHLTTDLRRVMSAGPEFLFSGHSHQSGDVQSGSIRRINPGALHRADAFSVAILNLKNCELRFLPVPR